MKFTQNPQVDWRHIAPGMPAQSALAENFEDRMRDQCSNEHLFFSMKHARAVISGRVHDYNTAGPHRSLGYLVPAAFAAMLSPKRASTLRTLKSAAPIAVAHGAGAGKCHHAVPRTAG